MITSKANIFIAAAGLTLWGWLPVLQSLSDIAALLVPPVTLAWIVYQWVSHKRPKP